MKFFKEITEWVGGGKNHTYLLNDDKTKMIGFVPLGESCVTKFKNPIGFSTRGRKFVEVKNTFGFIFTDSVEPGIQVIGSNGSVYYLTKTNNSYQCTCPGFSFWGDCKHVKSQNQS